MSVQKLRNNLDREEPPESFSPLVQALWYDANGNWERAHEIAQDIEGVHGARVHAYLHRKEGDLSNASYWYSRAGGNTPDVSLEEEWAQLAEELMEGTAK